MFPHLSPVESRAAAAEQADWEVYGGAKSKQIRQFVLPSDATALGSTHCHSHLGGCGKAFGLDWPVLLCVFWLTVPPHPERWSRKMQAGTALTQSGDNEPETKLSYRRGSASGEPFPLQGNTR